ncbi:cytidylate kinase family protein [Candidatus Microgenomates bacterium]|nr:cytidylate kinase family protein [Candidatus Microgenomates bacterium]
MKYKNITVSGLICTGTTTLSKLLAEKLGWERHSTGELQREYSKKNKIPLEFASQRPDQYERGLDAMVYDMLKNQRNKIIEGWLTGYLARDLPDVFKILLVCNEALRIDRLVNRENLPVEEAKELLETREKENLEKWTRLYGNDFWNPAKYDLVIDTYANSKEEALNKTLKALQVGH